MSVEMPERQQAASGKGEARCPGAPSTQEIIGNDKVAAPGWVCSESYRFLGDEDISTDRYIDPAFTKAELDKLWTRTWQFACREEHIPQIAVEYSRRVGTMPDIFEGTSPGAIEFGAKRYAFGANGWKRFDV